MPKVKVKIDNPDENGIGEIIVQGDNVFKGYLNDPEKTNEVLINGWCHTGDIGYIDENGFIFITGRQKDMIVLDNGKKIFPEEIEHVLMDLEYIKDVLVFADNSNGDDDLKLTAKIRINKKEIQEMYPNLEYNQILQKIWNDIKEINTTFPKYKYIKDVLITEEEFIKTTTLKIKRFKEVEKTKEELQNGKTISIKNI
jgi:AMP-dependent synthetase/ligase